MTTPNFKQHPSVDEGEVSVEQSQRFDTFLETTIKEVAQDDESRGEWLLRMKYFLRRRLQAEFRNPSFPWPRSSDIVMPLIDMMIDKLKPSFLNLVFGNNKKIVTFLPRNQRSIANHRRSEIFFNWFLNNKAEDFYEQLAIAVDRMLQYGHCVMKVFWEHRSENASQVLVRDQLPERLRNVMVQKGVTEKIAEEIFDMSGGVFAPLTKKEFDKPEVNQAIVAAIELEFALSSEDKIDKRAIDKIMDFMRNPEKYPDGATSVKTREVKYSAPKLAALSATDFIPQRGARTIQSMYRMTHVLYYTKAELRRRARDNKWSQAGVDTIVESAHAARRHERLNLELDISFLLDRSATLGSIAEPEIDVYQVNETYTYFDIDGDGIDERVVLTYEPTTKTLLKAVELPFDHGKWPFVQISFEQTSDRFYSSRGVPEKLDDLDQEITSQHRGKLNRMMIANAPTFKYRMGSEVNPNAVQWIPGQFLPVVTMGDIEPLQVPNLDMSFDKEEEILRTWAEQHIGGTDFGLHQQGAQDEARTAQEIRAIEFNRQQVLTVRAKSFQEKMKSVYNMMFDLFMQFPQPGLWVTLTGQQPEFFTRREIQGDFEIMPVGAVGPEDPLFQEQKALADLQVLATYAPLMAESAEFELNFGEALARYYESSDPAWAQLIVRRRSDEEVQDIKQRQAAMRELGDAINTNVPTSLEEQAIFAREMEGKVPFGKQQRVRGNGSAARSALS